MKYLIVTIKNERPYSHKWQKTEPTSDQVGDYLDQTDADHAVVITYKELFTWIKNK